MFQIASADAAIMIDVLNDFNCVLRMWVRRRITKIAQPERLRDRLERLVRPVEWGLGDVAGKLALRLPEYALPIDRILPPAARHFVDRRRV